MTAYTEIYTRTVTYTNWVLNEEAVSTITAEIVTSTSSYRYPTATNVFVNVSLTLESPLNCSDVDLLLDLPLNPDPDIAGIGVRVSCKDFNSKLLTEADHIGIPYLSLFCHSTRARCLLRRFSSQSLLETSRPTSLPRR